MTNTKDRKNFWDKCAEYYDRFLNRDAAAYEQLAEWLRPVVRHKAVLELAAGVVQTCRDLFFDGVRQPIGTWGSSASGARRKNDERFVGTGVLNVLSDGKGLAFILR